MKKNDICGRCGKSRGELVPVLVMGAQGFRKYLVCRKCKSEVDEERRAKSPIPNPSPNAPRLWRGERRLNKMADGVIVLRNELGADGIFRMHVMGIQPIGEKWRSKVPKEVPMKEYQDEIQLHHLEAEWKARGELVKFVTPCSCGKKEGCPVCHGSGWGWMRLVALWCLRPGERVSQAIGEASLAYAVRTGQDPEFAWVRSLPKGIESGKEIEIGGGVIVNLYEAEWMPEGAVAVGRGN